MNQVSQKQSNAVLSSDLERVVSLVYLQSAVTVGILGLQGVTTLGSPNTNSGSAKMKIIKVPAGIEISNDNGVAFIPDGNIKVLLYK